CPFSKPHLGRVELGRGVEAANAGEIEAMRGTSMKRRSFFKAGAAVAIAAAVPLRPAAAEAAAPKRILLKGGTIISMDPQVGNFIPALGCIDAGITCIIDNCHNSRSAAHSDAAVQALIDSGIRASHASGAPQTGDWDKQWPQDLERLQKRFFASTDQLVTLRMFAGMNREHWALARRLGIR